MASKWVTFRDELVGNLNFDVVTEQMKSEFSKWLLETALPMAEEAGNKFISEVKEQSKNEQGWCKVRDLIVLPFVINGGLWLVKTALEQAEKSEE